MKRPMKPEALKMRDSGLWAESRGAATANGCHRLGGLRPKGAGASIPGTQTP